MNRHFTRTAVRKPVRAAALAAAAGMMLVACGGSSTGTTTGSSSAPADTSPIKVGVLTDMTGAFGIVGKSNKAVAQFTIDEINASGGVLGRQLQLVLVDSASDPAVGAQVAQRLQDEGSY